MRVLVTGAASEIGRATCVRLARDARARGGNCQIAAVDRAPSDGMDGLVRELAALGAEALPLYGDLGSTDAPARVVAEAVATFGGLDGPDGLVSNAAINRPAPRADLSIEDGDRIFAVNVRSTFLLAQAAHGALAQPGGAADFIRAIEKLPEDVPPDVPGIWYRSQKEHWLSWLEAYHTPGASGRRPNNHHARYAYNHVVNVQMPFWLAEAAGVSPELVRQAREGAAGRAALAAKSATFRRCVSWEVAARALWGSTRRYTKATVGPASIPVIPSGDGCQGAGRRDHWVPRCPSTDHVRFTVALV